MSTCRHYPDGDMTYTERGSGHCDKCVEASKRRRLKPEAKNSTFIPLGFSKQIKKNIENSITLTKYIANGAVYWLDDIEKIDKKIEP